jgi:hypothetical protein
MNGMYIRMSYIQQETENNRRTVHDENSLLSFLWSACSILSKTAYFEHVMENMPKFVVLCNQSARGIIFRAVCGHGYLSPYPWEMQSRP